MPSCQLSSTQLDPASWTLILSVDDPEERKRGLLSPLLKSSVTNTKLEYSTLTLIQLADRPNQKALKAPRTGSTYDGPNMGRLYESVVSLFANDADGALQKKAYKIVNSMAETETRRAALKSKEELMRNILNTTAAATSTVKRP
ncbi:MAG: hypothetical protein J3Q66DRAFT_369388 [Benniella sp.]|nr:MAG: hypothetical protein J3Q66DRAFT_369388 [Benniella sp.]